MFKSYVDYVEKQTIKGMLIVLQLKTSTIAVSGFLKVLFETLQIRDGNW